MINLELLATDEVRTIAEDLNKKAKEENLDFYRVGFGDIESYLIMIPKAIIKENTLQEGTLKSPHIMNQELITYLIRGLTVPRYNHTRESQIPEEFKKKYPVASKALLTGVRMSNNEISLIKKGILRPFEIFEYLKEGEKLDAQKLPTLLMGIPLKLKKYSNLD
jgi:hypothetical protein